MTAREPWPEVTAMLALELLAIAAVKNDDLRSLAVVSEAWQDQGYTLESLADTLPGPRAESWDRIEKARYRRHRQKLRDQAQGLLYAVELLVAAGVLSERTINLARWPRRIAVDHRALGHALLVVDEERVPSVLSTHGVAAIPNGSQEDPS